MSVHHLERLFRPRSIAVIGASSRPMRAGAVVMRNLLAGGFDGPIMPVNPNRTHVSGVLCYPDVASLPLVPDLAVICSPSDTVAEQIMALGKRGVRAAVAITGGYSHSYESRGPALLDGIRRAQRESGLRLLGPDCLGLVVPGSKLNASFSHVDALPGKLGFVCRTAALAAVALDWARPRNIGFSACLSLGDCADIGFDDAIDYLSQDPQTRAILLFFEDLDERRNLLSAVRAAARCKPVLCIKRPLLSSTATANPASLTARLVTADAVADAALRRAGALRVGYIEDLFSAVDTLANAKPLNHERLTILTNSSTLGAIVRDELLTAQGELACLPEATLRQLDDALPFAWSRTNPVDILIDADGERYATALGILLEDRSLDRILVINAPTGVVSSEEAALAVIGTIRRASGLRDGRGGANIVTSWVGEETAANARKLFSRAGIPSYDTAARAAHAFLQVVNHRRNQAMLIETPPSLASDVTPAKAEAQAIIAKVLAEARDTLTLSEAVAVLAAYGLRVRPDARPDTPHPLLIGATTDAVFGPIILFGEGGDAAEVSRDTAIALPPLNQPLARDLMARTRIQRTLAMGGAKADAALAAINQALIRVSQLIIDLPELVDLDLNPIQVDDTGLWASGVRLRAAPVTACDRRRLAIRPYPEELAENATLRDGRPILVRPIRPEDEPAHHVLVSRLTPDDIRFRFFGFVRNLEHTQMARLTQIDYDREMAFIAEADGETLGVVRTITDANNAVAEFSIVIRSDLKGQGLGRLLLSKMIRYCHNRGTAEILGQVLPDNQNMLRLTRKLGFIARLNTEEEVIEVRRDLASP